MNEVDVEYLDKIIGKYEKEGSILKLAIFTDIKYSKMESIIEDIDYNLDNFGEGTEKIIRVIFYSKKFIALQSEDNGTRIGYYFTESFDEDAKENIFETINKDCIVRSIPVDELDI